MSRDSGSTAPDADGGSCADKRRRVASVDWTMALVASTSQFSGRHSELGTLHALNTSPSLSLEPRLGVVVSGFGGIGKTEFVKFYARTYHDHFEGNCIWIHAENVIAMRNSFLKLLKEQALDGGAVDISNHDLAQKCYSFFVGKKALFLFDNAENYGAVKEFLPTTASRNLVHVFTSRTGAPEDWCPTQFTNLALDVLTLADSVDFLRKMLSPKAPALQHELEYRSLAEELGCYPLALTQATAYVAKEHCRCKCLTYAISAFMHAFKLNDSAMELLDYKFWEEGGKAPYEKTLYTVLELSLSKIRSCSTDPTVAHVAIEILYRLAFCGADKVPLVLFLCNWPPSFQYAMGDQECVWRAVELLRRYSMITVQEERYISVHRLFQRIVRAHARSQEHHYISSLREMMSPYIVQRKDIASGSGFLDPDQRLFIAHALQLCKYTFEHQDDLLRFLRQNRNIVPFVQGLVDFHTGTWTLLCQHEFYQEALDLAIASAKLYAEGPTPLLGPGSEAALAMRLNTGRTYTKQHFCYKTHDEYRSAYDLAVRHLGSDHQLTLDLMCHLAWILSQPCLNDRTQARDFYQQCYERAYTALGPMDRITVLAKAGIGSVESLDDRHEQALAEYNEALIFEPLLDGILDDESYRIVFTNLQKVYTAMGQYADAYDASHRIVRRLEAKYGPLAIPTLIAKVNLVERLLDLRDFNRTRQVLDTIYSEAQRRLGENRLAFLELREHAATLQRETGPESVQDWVHRVYEDVLTRKKTTLAFNEERHESVIWTEYKVCQLHFRRRQWDKAMEVGHRVQQKLARLWGEDHGNTCKVKAFLWSVEQYQEQVTTGVWTSDYVCTEPECGQQAQEATPEPEPVAGPLSSGRSSVSSLMSPEMEPVEGIVDPKGQYDLENLTCSIPPCEGRIFSLRNVFVRHMGNIHDVNLYRDKRKERVYTCPHCAKQCGRADNLRSHINKRHGKQRGSDTTSV